MRVRTVGIIGAGTMGRGIAQLCATAGLKVVLADTGEEAAARGKAAVAATLTQLVAQAKLPDEDRAAALHRIAPAARDEDLTAVDLLIEAAPEKVALKTAILQRMAPMLRDDAILASTTSAISITGLAAALPHPERFLGLHFFNPAPAMRLVQLVRGLRTSDATHDTVETLVTQLGLIPVTVRGSPGFVVNRLLLPMLNEAFLLLAEGEAEPTDIDEAMKLGCHHPMGPLALADLIGLDVLLAVMETLHGELGEAKYRPAPLLREMVAAGYVGRKSGRGVYRY